MLSVHVHEKGGARGPRELEETVLAARRYEGSLNLTDIAAAVNIAGHELDGPRCEMSVRCLEPFVNTQVTAMCYRCAHCCVQMAFACGL